MRFLWAELVLQGPAAQSLQLTCSAFSVGRALQMLGASVEGPEQRELNGLPVELWPRVSWSPLFALTFADLEASPCHTAALLMLGQAGPAPAAGCCSPDNWIGACTYVTAAQRRSRLATGRTNAGWA